MPWYAIRAWGTRGACKSRAADIILLNKADLVSAEQLAEVTARLRQLNEEAPILPTLRCQVDPDVLFGLLSRTGGQPPAASSPTSVWSPSATSPRRLWHVSVLKRWLRI